MSSWAVLYVGIRHVGGVHVALEQQAPWGRPPFGTLMQLCFGMAREAITYLLSNGAEKPVSRPPGSCCALECAVPSRPSGQQPTGKRALLLLIHVIFGLGGSRALRAGV